MTLKERKFEVEIQKPENRLNIAECMRKAHYSKATTRAGSKYRQLRKITQRLPFLDPERINKDTEQNRRESRKAKAYSVVEAIDYRRSKIAGMITDKSENKNTNITEEKKSDLNILAKRLSVMN